MEFLHFSIGLYCIQCALHRTNKTHMKSIQCRNVLVNVDLLTPVSEDVFQDVWIEFSTFSSVVQCHTCGERTAWRGARWIITASLKKWKSIHCIQFQISDSLLQNYQGTKMVTCLFLGEWFIAADQSTFFLLNCEVSGKWSDLVCCPWGRLNVTLGAPEWRIQ